MKSALFLLSVLLLAAQYYCAPQLTLSSAYAGEAPQRIIDNYPLVQPLKSISVTVKVVNTGDAWTADQVVFQLVDNTFGWTGTLSTTGAVAQGASATFTGLITAPNKVGVQVISLQAGISGSVFGPIAEVTVDIDCSDGDTCNGEELFVNNTCWSAELAPCGYSNECTVNTCNDTLGVCYSTKTNAEGCTACLRSSCTYLGCEGRQCGTDGCNGNCGQCAPGTYCDSEGQCITTTVQGTCTNPIPLFPANQTDLSGVHYVSGNTSEGYHYHVIPCNMFSTSPELVWSFTVPEGQSYGFDFRSYGPIEDTIMDVRKGSCDGPDSYVGCNDDGTPPGNYGSRVARLIGPGTYLIIVKGYDDSIQGVVDLRLAFAKNCVPKCNSQFCGDDECGGSCGDCGEGEQCTTEFKCAPINCVPECTGKQCGLDGCGGYCGECTDGNLCNMDNNQCEYFAPCDGLNPVCVGCTEEQFCGSDCACYNYTAPLPDLYVDTPRLGEDIVFDQDTFKETSCAYREGCILGTGLRRLLRFSVLTTNQGHADIALPSPGSRPDLFSWSPCHGHYHFEEYAYYALLSKDGTVVVEHGRKQGYCVLDGSRQADGNIACVGTFTCSEQGISVGWADTYTFDLDCQWIDITDVPPGDYTLFVELNKARKIMESNYENNKAFVPVTVPIWNKNSTSNNGPTTTGTPISTTTGTSTTNGVGSTTTTGNAAVSTTSAASTIILSVFVVFVVILSML